MDGNSSRPQNALSWLLEPGTPGVRYLALRDIKRLPQDDPELQTARRKAHTEGPIAAVLEKMQPEGFWCEPGAGYLPKYRSTVWAVILLAQLGARIEEDERIARACAYVLDHALTGRGQFSMDGTPSSTIDCLQGNLYWALRQLGCQDERLPGALEWMARTVTGEGIAPLEDKKAAVRYYAGKCGPGFACGANNKLPCAWGAAKVMLAFSLLAPDERTPLIEAAIRQGVDFLFSVDPASGAYPTGYSDKPSRNWWKLGFPVFYVTDLLQIVEALDGLGYRDDPRLANVLTWVRSRQDAAGRWALDYHYNDKTWVVFGAPGQPNPWVTLRALRMLGEG